MTDISMSALAMPRDHAPDAIQVGDVFSRSGKLFAAHWATYCIIELIGYAPLMAVSYLLIADAAAHRGAGDLRNALIIPAGLLAFACLIVAHAVIYVGAAGDASSIGFSPSRSVGAALRRSPALIGAAILVAIYSVLATFLLVIPGIIVFCVYSVVLPCCVVEGLGPIKSMSRSAFLSKGNRWRIFGIFLVLHVGLGIFNQIIVILPRAFAGPLSSAGVSLILGGLIGAFSAVVLSVLYTRLRVAREGVDIDQIAKVFD
jgi:hypothetical protein